MHTAIVQYVYGIVSILRRQTSVDDCLRDTAREWEILINQMSVGYHLYVNLHWSGDATRELSPKSYDPQGVDYAIVTLEEAIRKCEKTQCTSGSEIEDSIRNLICVMYECDDKIVFYSESRGYLAISASAMGGPDMLAYIEQYVRKVVEILGSQTSVDDCRHAAREWDILYCHVGAYMGIYRYLRISMYWPIYAPYALAPNPSPDASAWQGAISKIQAALYAYDVMQGTTAAGVVDSIDYAVRVLCGIEAKAGKSAIVYTSDTIEPWRRWLSERRG